MKRILAIVVTYNGASWIRKCLESLSASDYPINVIVIDNCSKDETVEIVREEFPGVILIESNENLGFGAGNNLGLRYAIKADFDFAFLLNQDAWTDRWTIGKLIEVHQEQSEFGILSPIHFNGDGSLLDRRFLEHLGLRNRRMYRDLFSGPVDEVYEVEFVNAAAWLVSRNCITEVGFFDPVFPHYGEDENFVARCKQFGFKVGIVPGSKIWHDREERLATISRPKALDRNALRTRWLTIITNPNVSGSASKYLQELAKFLLKSWYHSRLKTAQLLPSFLRLMGLRSLVKAARARMAAGFSGYDADNVNLPETD